MNEQLSLRSFDWLSFSDFDAISVDLAEVGDDTFNVIMTLVVSLDDDFTITGGLVLETEIYVDSPKKGFDAVQAIASLGMFPPELILSNGYLHNVEGDLVRELDWTKEVDTSAESV